MKICQPHWDKLRQAINDRGLSGLIAGSGEKATESLVRQLEGSEDLSDYDPLMACNWAFHTEALRLGGLYLMGTDENGNQYCPLCEADFHGGHAQEWIDGCADAQLEFAREKGLIARVQ